MARIKVERDNVILSIEQEDLAQYEARGYKKLGATEKAASKNLDKEVTKLEKENEKLTKKVEEVENAKKELAKANEELTQKASEIEAEKTELAKANEELTAKIAELEKNVK